MAHKCVPSTKASIAFGAKKEPSATSASHLTLKVGRADADNTASVICKEWQSSAPTEASRVPQGDHANPAIPTVWKPAIMVLICLVVAFHMMTWERRETKARIQPLCSSQKGSLSLPVKLDLCLVPRLDLAWKFQRVEIVRIDIFFSTPLVISSALLLPKEALQHPSSLVATGGQYISDAFESSPPAQQ